MDSLVEVVAILRNEDRQDLVALLADARVNLEYLDYLISMTSDAEHVLTHASIYAPISACKALRELPEGDKDAILDALREVWPLNEGGGIIIQGISYHIDKDSLTDDLTHLFTSPIGWQRVDRTMDSIRELLTTASTEEQCQGVGLLCRDGLVSMAQAVFDPMQHPPLPNDKTEISNTDVKRMMARYVASECSGASSKEIRKSVNAAVDLANKVTHGRTSDYRDAALCAQTTFNVIGLIAIISGKRDLDEQGQSVEPNGHQQNVSISRPSRSTPHTIPTTSTSRV